MSQKRKDEKLRLQPQKDKEAKRRAARIPDWHPRDFCRHRSERGEQKQVIPFLAQNHGGDAQVQKRDVTEKKERIVGTTTQ